MIGPDVLHNQRRVARRRDLGKRPSDPICPVKVMCECGTCIRCRKREWMRAARRRLHKGYWKH